MKLLHAESDLSTECHSVYSDRQQCCKAFVPGSFPFLLPVSIQVVNLGLSASKACVSPLSYGSCAAHALPCWLNSLSFLVLKAFRTLTFSIPNYFQWVRKFIKAPSLFSYWCGRENLVAVICKLLNSYTVSCKQTLNSKADFFFLKKARKRRNQFNKN